MTRTRLLAALTATAAFAVSASASDQFDHIEAGRYQAILGDCAACHSMPGKPALSGGAPLSTPFGTLVPPNITPDMETGIGKWSESDFRNAMKTGIGHDHERLYPAMPYPAYTHMTDEDVSNLWSYLQRVEPVHNPVQANQLPFPFSVRLVMAGWNWLNFKPEEFKPDDQKSAEWNRGAYIVQGAGHCGTCHSPKSLTGADKNDQFLQGGNLESWFAPNITADPHRGLGNWSADDIVEYLKTGSNRYDTASGPMAEEVAQSSQYWSDADLKSVATYLKDVGGQGAPAPQPLPSTDAAMVAGQAIYADRCSACHIGTGQGVPHLFPELAKASLVNNDDPTSLIRVVLAGSQAGATSTRPTAPAMPSLGWELNDAEVASVLTYVRNSWGNAAPAVTVGEVAKLRASLKN